MKKSKEKFDQYCPDCGTALIRVPVPAEKATYLVHCWGEVYSQTLGTAFNQETGLRQFGIRVMCPNARWWKFNHTNYIDEDSLHDCDLRELLNLYE